MDFHHRDLIQRNTVKLVEGINDVEIILDHLYTQKIFSDNIIDRIKMKKTRRDRIRELLEHLKRRPTSDFPKFVKILRDTGQDHIANVLDNSGVSAQIRPEERHHNSSPADSDVHSVNHRFVSSASKPTCQVSEEGEGASVLASGEDYNDRDLKSPYTLPEVWPAKEVLLKPVSVRPVTQKEMKSKWEENKRQKQQPSKNDSMYTMCGRRRAIIISNELFHDPKYNRYGNKFDETRIKTLLEMLDFDVEVWQEKTYNELFCETGLLANEADMSRDDYQCFLMVILSHGKQDFIRTVDNIEVPTAKFVDYFDAKRSHRFAGKPKIFLVQACQGESEDEGTIVKRTVEVTDRFMSLEVTDSGTVPRGAHKLPSFSDILVVKAAAHGFVSWRDTKYGTWFIQAVIEVFSNLACEDDLMTMLRKVCNLVSRGCTRDGKYYQISNITDCTLTKAIYFFPGLK